ncbi:hypothetical protein Dimus_032341 [Dionaea muscipula]
MQEHFMTIQRIAYSTTLPHVMNCLSSKVAQDLDVSLLTERLQQGKGQPYSLTSLEKLELWDKLKILSFTRMVLSLWVMTMLTLYIRVQVNILGRHIYINTGRGVQNSHWLVRVTLLYLTFFSLCLPVHLIVFLLLLLSKYNNLYLYTCCFFLISILLSV